MADKNTCEVKGVEASPKPQSNSTESSGTSCERSEQQPSGMAIILDSYSPKLKKQLNRFNEIQVLSMNAAKPRSVKWYTQRYSGWGSSEADSALGFNPWKKRGELVLDKALCLDGQCNEIMAGGIANEPAIRAFLGHMLGVEIYETANVPTEVEFIRDSSDGQFLTKENDLPKPVVVEIKNVQRRKVGRSIPKYYVNQVQNHLFATGYDECVYIEAKVGSDISLAKPGNCGTFEPLEVFDEVPAVKPDGFWCVEDFYMTTVKPDPEWPKKIPILEENWRKAMFVRNIFKKRLGDEIRKDIELFERESDDDIFELIRMARFRPKKIADCYELELSIIESAVEKYRTIAMEIKKNLTHSDLFFKEEREAYERAYLSTTLII